MDGVPNEKLIKAGGLFALLGAFLAWYNAFAGIADDSNSFFVPPVVHFPWSEKKRSARRRSKPCTKLWYVVYLDIDII